MEEVVKNFDHSHYKFIIPVGDLTPPEMKTLLDAIEADPFNEKYSKYLCVSKIVAPLPKKKLFARLFGL